MSGEGNAVTVPPVPRTGHARLRHPGEPRGAFALPRDQNAALRAAGLDGRYVAIACQPEDIAPVMRTLARAGGGGNVTVPHKGRAAATLDDAAAAVARTGRVQHFWGEGARIRGGQHRRRGSPPCRARAAGGARPGSARAAGGRGGAVRARRSPPSWTRTPRRSGSSTALAPAPWPWPAEGRGRAGGRGRRRPGPGGAGLRPGSERNLPRAGPARSARGRPRSTRTGRGRHGHGLFAPRNPPDGRRPGNAASRPWTEARCSCARAPRFRALVGA